MDVIISFFGGKKERVFSLVCDDFLQELDAEGFFRRKYKGREGEKFYSPFSVNSATVCFI